MQKISIVGLLLGATTLFSCSDTSVEKIIFTSSDGAKMEFYVEDGDGKLTSGNKGRHRFREVRLLQFSTLKTSYRIKADGVLYYFPLDREVEIPE